MDIPVIAYRRGKRDRYIEVLEKYTTLRLAVCKAFGEIIPAGVSQITLNTGVLISISLFCPSTEGAVPYSEGNSGRRESDWYHQ
jgi:hypothetical protein